MDMLELKGITKRYKDFALDQISFSLPKGYIMGYVGRNGAGKTTTINCITHLCEADQGTVRVNGITYHDDPVHYKEQIGLIGDESYFPKEMTIRDIYHIQKSFYSSFDTSKFNTLLKEFNLPESKKIESFSRGMKVKLMFAIVLSRETKLLVLDEATNGLDPVMRDQILNLLQEYISDGEKSTLFSTHMLEDLEQIADYIAFIDNGRIILKEVKDELMESFLLLKGPLDRLERIGKNHMIGIKKQEFGFEALIRSDDAAGLGEGFILDKPSIDQIMIHMIREQG